MFLGIEIGGTKIQLGVGSGESASLVALERFAVDPQAGALGILDRLAPLGQTLVARHGVQAVGIGFGGPVDTSSHRVLRSHQIDGWSDFPLATWANSMFRLPVALGNDADAAALAEATLGSGRGQSPLLYVTVGSGVGGALVIDGEIYRGNGSLSAVEIGHLRPGLHADRPEATVESLASGWSIAATMQSRLAGPVAHRLASFVDNSSPLRPEEVRQHLIAVEETEEQCVADLLERCDGESERLTAKIVAQAAQEGNTLALLSVHQACQALGWGIAQAVTLLGPSLVVVGGGVSMIGEVLFFTPLREEVGRYVFPPLRDTVRIVPAELGEEAVVHGAIALAQRAVSGK